MTLSKKYNEIMDRVSVTDEMRDRLKERIENEDFERLAVSLKVDEDADFSDVFFGRKRYSTAKILGGLAAACVLLLLIGTITMRIPSGKMNMGTGAAYEEIMEAAEEDTLLETNGADTTVGASETGGAVAKEPDSDEIKDAEDYGLPFEAAQEEQKDMLANVTEDEIRQAIETYIGQGYAITDEMKAENVITYTVSDTKTGDVFSHIRIDVGSGNVEIEYAQTNEIRELTFEKLMEQ